MYHFKIYGSDQILTLPKVAVHVSRSAPETVLEKGKLLFAKLLGMDIAIGGGWQSKAEKTLQRMFTAEKPAHLIIFIAKSFAAYKVPTQLKTAFSAGKIAIIEPALEKPRLELEGVDIRDQVSDDLIEHHLFIYIHPGGRLEDKFRKLLKAGKEVFVLNHPLNRHFFTEGTTLIDEHTLDRLVF